VHHVVLFLSSSFDGGIIGNPISSTSTSKSMDQKGQDNISLAYSTDKANRFLTSSSHDSALSGEAQTHFG
jgi:hypothetical protein